MTQYRGTGPMIPMMQQAMAQPQPQNAPNQAPKVALTVSSYRNDAIKSMLQRYFDKDALQDYNLRVEQEIKSGATALNFRLNEGKDETPPEKRLSISDMFVPTQIAFFVYKTNDATYNGNTANIQGNYSVQQFPDPAIFTATGLPQVPEWQSLLGYFNGGIALRASGDEIINFKKTEGMLKPPSGYPYSFQTPAPGMRQIDWIDLDITPILNGQKQLDLVLNSAEGADLVLANGADGTTNRAGFLFSGIRIRNAAEAFLLKNAPAEKVKAFLDKKVNVLANRMM